MVLFTSTEWKSTIKAKTSSFLPNARGYVCLHAKLIGETIVYTNKTMLPLLTLYFILHTVQYIYPKLTTYSSGSHLSFIRRGPWVK